MKIMTGDCIEAMAELSPDSVDSIVTDPPYGLGFLGKEWDELPPGEEWGQECLRVLKPGGYLLAFGGSRTYHRLACAVEDAGFEIRDQLQWLYAVGFPKSLDVAKAVESHVKTGKSGTVAKRQTVMGEDYKPSAAYGSFRRKERAMDNVPTVAPQFTPETAEAQQWQGWGTALKPAHEPIVLARKPLAGTVAANVVGLGTGAINIDAGRIGERWPSNVLLNQGAGALLDEQTGEQTSRFFYCAKASKGERTAGDVENSHPTVKPISLMRYLVRLVTPPEGTVLDPFLGSGTTGIAAGLEGFDFIGIERDPDYVAIAEARIKHWASQPQQLGLEAA